MKWLMVLFGVRAAQTGAHDPGFGMVVIGLAALLLLVVVAAVIVNRVRDRRSPARARRDD